MNCASHGNSYYGYARGRAGISWVIFGHQKPPAAAALAVMGRIGER